MQYEIVELDAKTVVGKSIVTFNDDPKMGEEIGKLWYELYDPQNGYFEQIENKLQDSAVGLYSDYSADGKFVVTVGAEVSDANNPELTTKTLPKSKYAKFSVHGNMVRAVAAAWGEIWKTDLDRTFTGDFEEYLPCDNCPHRDACDYEACEECDINIYVAIR